VVPEAGIEPARLAAGDFESPASTNFTTPALCLPRHCLTGCSEFLQAPFSPVVFLTRRAASNAVQLRGNLSERWAALPNDSLVVCLRTARQGFPTNRKQRSTAQPLLSTRYMSSMRLVRMLMSEADQPLKRERSHDQSM
jgi:hypothetical protein